MSKITCNFIYLTKKKKKRESKNKKKERAILHAESPKQIKINRTFLSMDRTWDVRFLLSVFFVSMNFFLFLIKNCVCVTCVSEILWNKIAYYEKKSRSELLTNIKTTTIKRPKNTRRWMKTHLSTKCKMLLQSAR